MEELPLYSTEYLSLYNYGVNFLKRNFPLTEDPSSVTLLALSLSLQSYDPAHLSGASFKTHFRYKLLSEAKLDRTHNRIFKPIYLSQLQTAFISQFLTCNLAYLPDPILLQEDPFPSLILRLDVLRALSILPPISRRIVINHLILQYSLKEISLFLSIPYHLVRFSYNQSVTILQDYLGEGYAQEGDGLRPSGT